MVTENKSFKTFPHLVSRAVYFQIFNGDFFVNLSGKIFNNKNLDA